VTDLLMIDRWRNLPAVRPDSPVPLVSAGSPLSQLARCRRGSRRSAGAGPNLGAGAR